MYPQIISNGIPPVHGLAEHDKERISCPHCGSKNVEQEAAAFFAVTGKKS